MGQLTVVVVARGHCPNLPIFPAPKAHDGADHSRLAWPAGRSHSTPNRNPHPWLSLSGGFCVRAVSSFAAGRRELGARLYCRPTRNVQPRALVRNRAAQRTEILELGSASHCSSGCARVCCRPTGWGIQIRNLLAAGYVPTDRRPKPRVLPIVPGGHQRAMLSRFSGRFRGPRWLQVGAIFVDVKALGLPAVAAFGGGVLVGWHQAPPDRRNDR